MSGIFEMLGKHLEAIMPMGQKPNGKYSPMQLNENGELIVDTEITVNGDVNVSDVKVGTSDGGTTLNYLTTNANGNLIEANSGTINTSINNLQGASNRTFSDVYTGIANVFAEVQDVNTQTKGIEPKDDIYVFEGTITDSQADEDTGLIRHNITISNDSNVGDDDIYVDLKTGGVSIFNTPYTLKFGENITLENVYFDTIAVKSYTGKTVPVRILCK